MLYRRGRPTSVELLLLMVVPELTLALSGHSPLCLNHLLCLVGAARGLVTLGRVEVLQVRLVRAARIAKVGAGVGTRAGTGRHAAIFTRGGLVGQIPGDSSASPAKCLCNRFGSDLAELSMGCNSRRPPPWGPPANIFPLLTRFSTARSTSSNWWEKAADSSRGMAEFAPDLAGGGVWCSQPACPEGGHCDGS
jgi:hypothetical protein